MGKNLVVVESPAKAKTIEKYLGKQFEVKASYGHVRDLLPKQGAVDVAHDFAMHYEPISRNARYVDALAKALKKADALYLATDPDREGEAISWHVYQMLQDQGVLKNKPVYRIVFHEITKNAVQKALEHPREIDMHLVNAQQARRALDYLVGFNLSPLLWRKVHPKLSAGRVQSPALRLIVEREEQIDAFHSDEYWTIQAQCESGKQPFSARLVEYEGKKLELLSISSLEQAESIESQLNQLARGNLTVGAVEEKQKKKNPSAPFITSTLQQEAARKLGFSAQRTMKIAQQLYEGVNLEGESVGLITYMRTDSVHLANEAIHEVRQYIGEHFGSDKLPSGPNFYKTRSKNAQEAHEAIRPTSVFRAPEIIQKSLTPEQLKLYQLIWKRTVASQMVPALFNTVAVDLLCGEGNRFRANGMTLVDPGFIVVYQEGVDDEKDKENDENNLPPLKTGEKVKLLAIQYDQHFTEPPPRYSEASLIKALEEYGIGRPSTYASIISTLQQRGYAELIKKRFKPTDVGRIVNKFLKNHFTQYVDYDFTAKLEDSLDSVARGELVWIPLLRQFWEPFKTLVNSVDKSVDRQDVVSEKLDEKCPKCGSPLSIRLGRNGRFIGCTAYPDCDYTRNVSPENASESAVETVPDRTCPLCQAPLIYRQGRYGRFIGCSQYPQCKFIESLSKPVDTSIECPECKQGTLLKRQSKRGKVFYSCSRYPKCNYAIWNEPLGEPCPKCGWPILMKKVTKRKGEQKICPHCHFGEESCPLKSGE